MIKILITALILVLLSCNKSNLKQISETELINRIANNEMPEPATVKIVTKDGAEIGIDSLKSLEQTGKYFEDFYVNDRNEIVQILIRLKTNEDEKLLDKINQKYKEVNHDLNEDPEVELVEINCNDIVTLLQKVYDRDQGIRKQGTIDRNIDHENLEIIISVLEKCGMPTLDEVSKEQISGIWLVLQHAPPKYQSKYISLLENSADKGDLDYSAIAFMKDRALMYEGKPQIYGSQVSDGELYKLFEPEYVDQRRREIGMGSLKKYLNHFNIEFNVEQKIK